MRRRGAISLLISGLSAFGLYRYRRRIFSRLLGLPPALHDVAVERSLRVPMPDGVELVADRYRPRSPGRFPTVLVRTPYDRKNAVTGFLLRLLAKRGYNVVAQDVRGRFDSEGEFDAFAGEDADGRATMDWVSVQPWFDGSLGMWGLSYLGLRAVGGGPRCAGLPQGHHAGAHRLSISLDLLPGRRVQPERRPAIRHPRRTASR